jgi:hypothetical protein
LFVCGCEIEEKIESAGNKCENKIVQLLETVEETCLTKEEILLLIREANGIDAGSASYSVEDDGATRQ